ncbi:MAG: hypothetical protein HQL66_06840 [Magnetococcales bacterium]|nr:hypothetical protein [Magnetococcales bacterium]
MATALIEDSVNGALILSLIDFILSFVMIAGIGVVLAFLPLINKLGVVDEEKLRKGGH